MQFLQFIQNFANTPLLHRISSIVDFFSEQLLDIQYLSCKCIHLNPISHSTLHLVYVFDEGILLDDLVGYIERR